MIMPEVPAVIAQNSAHVLLGDVFCSQCKFSAGWLDPAEFRNLLNGLFGEDLPLVKLYEVKAIA